MADRKAQQSSHVEDPGRSAPHPGGTGPEPARGPTPSGPVRKACGVVLYVGWVVMLVIWVWTNIHQVVHGDGTAAATAACALAMLFLLGGMEGLEVSVIDRSDELWPGKPPSYLAEWLAARQLFVALIVTTATLLANRSVLFVPGGSTIKGGLATGAFDTVFTGLTVLWFAQIVPKILGAMDPDRYLRALRPALFPIVHVVHRLGVSQPGEWTASAIGHRVHWASGPGEAPRRARLSHGAIWAELFHHRRHGPHSRSMRAPGDGPGTRL